MGKNPNLLIVEFPCRRAWTSYHARDAIPDSKFIIFNSLFSRFQVFHLYMQDDPFPLQLTMKDLKTASYSLLQT